VAVSFWPTLADQQTKLLMAANLHFAVLVKITQSGFAGKNQDCPPVEHRRATIENT